MHEWMFRYQVLCRQLNAVDQDKYSIEEQITQHPESVSYERDARTVQACFCVYVCSLRSFFMHNLKFRHPDSQLHHRSAKNIVLLALYNTATRRAGSIAPEANCDWRDP